ncbi:MAG: hypothetical protein KBB83_07865 [Alphaproteobacteria bacterium]|nr:hypothetical protein [Alphaproteobacteria bacterium]
MNSLRIILLGLALSYQAIASQPISEETPLRSISTQQASLPIVEENSRLALLPAWTDHINAVLDKPNKVNKLALSLASTSPLVFPVFAELSKTCGGMSDIYPALANAPVEFLCGVGGGVSVASIFFVTIYYLPSTYAPADTPSEFYNTRVKDKLWIAAKNGAYFLTGAVANIPMFYLNQTQLAWTTNYIGMPALITWSSIVSVSGSISYIWPTDDFVKWWMITPLQRIITGRKLNKDQHLLDERVKRKYLASSARIKLFDQLNGFMQLVQNMTDDDVISTYESITKSSSHWENLISLAKQNLSEAHAPSKAYIYTKRAICVAAAGIGVFSGYANWPVAVESIDSFVECYGGKTNLGTAVLGNLVGAAGFVTSGTLGAVASYSTFDQIVEAVVGLPTALVGLPANLKTYFSRQGTIKDKMEPIAGLAMYGTVLYLSTTSALPQVMITIMSVDPGAWSTFVQVCAGVGNFTTSWFSLASLTNVLKNKLFTSHAKEARHALLQMTEKFKHHVEYLRDEVLLELSSRMYTGTADAQVN